ncbi:MAG TPA: hypothetical protein VGG34_10325 [Opitutaceae bacterium]
MVAELPEDSVVGVRFITYAISFAAAFAAVLFTGWYAYSDFNLRHQISDSSQRLEDDHWDVVEIRRLQHFYEQESKKIESAYSEMRNPIFMSGLMSELGKTLPDKMMLDLVEFADGRIVIRGRLRESSDKASIAIGKYLGTLRDDPAIGPQYDTINITDLDRSQDNDQMMNFTITMVVKKRPA